MTRGFEREPFYGEPYNPAYYPQFFERYGFEPAARWYSWDVEREALETIWSAAHDARHEAGYSIRGLDLGRFDQELRRWHALLVECFRHNFGFSEVSYEEFKPVFGPMESIAISELAPMLLDADGELVGCIFSYPDVGPQVRSRLGGADPARASERALPRLVLHTVALLERARGAGNVRALVDRTFRWILDQGYTEAVGALVKEGPSVFDRIGPSTRDYTVYHRGMG
jgi:hypothetical protein